MAHIKIGETLIKNVSLTDSGDLLGMKFMTNMTLSQLENVFTPATYPEFRIVNDNGDVIGVYKNRKFVGINIDILEHGNVVNLALQVTPAKIEEVELLTNQVNAQAAKIEAQALVNAEHTAQIAEQTSVIEAQANEIAEQAHEIEILKNSLNDTQAILSATQEELATTQTALTEAQATNDMLMECVLEISEVVYA